MTHGQKKLEGHRERSGFDGTSLNSMAYMITRSAARSPTCKFRRVTIRQTTVLQLTLHRRVSSSSLCGHLLPRESRQLENSNDGRQRTYLLQEPSQKRGGSRTHVARSAVHLSFLGRKRRSSRGPLVQAELLSSQSVSRLNPLTAGVGATGTRNTAQGRMEKQRKGQVWHGLRA